MKFPAFDPINLKNNVDSLSIIELALSSIISDPNQPRKHFHQEALQKLASSIKKYGVIQPIIVRQIEHEKYQIIAGERRWRASQMAELEVIPAIIQSNEAEEDVAISLIENIQREELNPIELAEAFFNLNKNHHLSHDAIATMVGKSRATVTNVLRLLNLSNDVRELLINGQLEMGHARCLLTLSPQQQVLIALKIMESNLTVRETEKLVQQSKTPNEKKTQSNIYSRQTDTWSKKLTSTLSSKVNVKMNEKGEGKIVIHFSSPEEVDWLVQRLSKDELL